MISLNTNSAIFVGFDEGTSGSICSKPRREGESKAARVRDGKNEGKGKEKSCHKGSCSVQRKSKLCSMQFMHVTFLCIKMHQPHFDDVSFGAFLSTGTHYQQSIVYPFGIELSIIV